MTNRVAHWTEAALGLLFPPVCEICGERRAELREGLVCPTCWQTVRFIRPPFCERCGLPYPGELTTPFTCGNCVELKLHFRFARSAVVARGIVRDAIHRYKYQRSVWLEPFLADLLVRAAGPALAREQWDALVPVPLFPVKQREREFNQATRLAMALSAATGIPMDDHSLRRVVSTGTQTRLSREERAANMRGVFALRSGQKLRGRRLVIVDDVFTTGATTSACAQVLRGAGAADVCVWTVARGL